MNQLTFIDKNFNEKTIRSVIDENQPYFVVSDICKMLYITNVSQCVQIIPDKWKKTLKINTASGEQHMNVVNESGLYKIFLKSNKQTALNFQDFVLEKVLPFVCKNGLNVVNNTLELENQIKQLKLQNRELCRLTSRKNKKIYKTGNCIYIVINKTIKNNFKIGQTDDINKRMMSFNNANPEEFILHKNWYTRFHQKIEKLAHDTFKKYRVSLSNEWFEISILPKVIEYIDLQVSIQEKFDTSDSSITDIKEDKDDDKEEDNEYCNEDDKEQNFEEISTLVFIDSPTKKCCECLQTISLSKFFLRKDKKSEDKTDPNDPSIYRSRCKKCTHKDTVERRQKVKENSNYNKKVCVDCDCVFELNMFYKKNDDSLHDNCISCYNKKNDLTDTIRQCISCKKMLDPTNFHVHTKNIVKKENDEIEQKVSLRNICKTCRNTRIVENRKKEPKNIVTCTFCDRQVSEVKLKVHQKTKLCLIKQGKLQPEKRKSFKTRIVIQYDKKNNEIKRYPSLMEASESTNINYAKIQSCCSGRSLTCHGFIWKYAK
jgi:prophage antirepressor-like protein